MVLEQIETFWGCLRLVSVLMMNCNLPLSARKKGARGKYLRILVQEGKKTSFRGKKHSGTGMKILYLTKEIA